MHTSWKCMTRSACQQASWTVTAMSRNGLTIFRSWSKRGKNSMTDTALQAPPIEPAARSSGPNLDKGFNPLTLILFMGVMAAGLLYVAYSVYSDVEATGTKVTTYLPFLMLFVALLIALGFEFVNGFHDTANAVATVIYTHSLPAEMAVVWSGAVQLPRRAHLDRRGRLRHRLAAAGRADPAGRQQRGLRHGVRAADRGHHLEPRHLVARPARLQLAHPDRLDHRRRHRQCADLRGHDGTSGVDWSKATEIGYALLLSPLVGFVFSALLLLALKFLVRNPALYAGAQGQRSRRRWWIRGLLILTCTGVSFAHGSNDGQKGMGLIMLILIGTVPTAYALNRTPAAEPRRIVPDGLAGGRRGDREAGRGLPCAGRSAARRHALRLAAQDRRGHLRVARRPGQGHRAPGRPVRLDRQDPGRVRRQRRATTCTSPPRRCAS